MAGSLVGRPSSRADGESGPTRHFLAPSGSGTRSRSASMWPSLQTVDGAWAIFKLCFRSSAPFVGVCDLGASGANGRLKPPQSTGVAVAAAVGRTPGGRAALVERVRGGPLDR